MKRPLKHRCRERGDKSGPTTAQRRRDGGREILDHHPAPRASPVLQTPDGRTVSPEPCRPTGPRTTTLGGRLKGLVGVKILTVVGARPQFLKAFAEHGIKRPFDDDFVVFPPTVMGSTIVVQNADPEQAWEECEHLFSEADEHDAVTTVLWHQRYFNRRDCPRDNCVCARLVERTPERDVDRSTGRTLRTARADAWDGNAGSQNHGIST